MTSQTRTDTALLAMRLMLGTVFVFHGAQKLFGLFGGYGIDGTAGFMEGLGIPFPTLSATLAGTAELAGGLALWTGFGQRLLAAPLTFTMLVAAFSAHSGFNSATGGMEYPLVLAVFAAGLGVVGPGRFAFSSRKLSAAVEPGVAPVTA